MMLASWTSLEAQPFWVARQRRAMAEWSVSRETALRRPAESADGEQESGRSLRDLLSKAGRGGQLLREPATSDEGQSLPLCFDDVFRRYAPYVGAVVLQLIGRPGDVDDVVQDVFIQAHRGLAKLRDPAAVRPWLRRIAVRRARRWLRKRWVRRWFGESDVDLQAELVDASASPEQRAQIAHIYRMLERMPKDERIVWVLRMVEGETLESIAELLSCSVSTVQRRLRTAQAAMGEIR
ncbi:MAG TPA: sigma-70 family RNA polymerase sigma factor [Polyangiaceae bacterium]|nr:sigma-70 family RNA polymerase sigma factor [Polyangiaceae bacterium]